MSFHVSVVGSSEGIKKHLAEYSTRLDGQSKEEFDAARPALDILLDQNFGAGVVHLSVSGHAQFQLGKKTYGACSVELKNIGTLAV